MEFVVLLIPASQIAVILTLLTAEVQLLLQAQQQLLPAHLKEQVVQEILLLPIGHVEQPVSQENPSALIHVQQEVTLQTNAVLKR